MIDANHPDAGNHRIVRNIDHIILIVPYPCFQAAVSGQAVDGYFSRGDARGRQVQASGFNARTDAIRGPVYQLREKPAAT